MGESIAEVAAGLTKAQREDLTLSVEGLSISGTGWLGRMRRLCEAGLTRRVTWRIIGRTKLTHSASYVATPLGIAVRNHLISQGADHDR